MLKKIYISGLVLILIVSTTGLTYTFHLCKMMSDSEAAVCEMEHKKVQRNCCMDENVSGQRISTYQSGCCEIQTIEKRISDEFISFSHDKKLENTFTITSAAFNTLTNNFDLNRLDFHPNNNSPPCWESDLFIFNSTFLI